MAVWNARVVRNVVNSIWVSITSRELKVRVGVVISSTMAAMPCTAGAVKMVVESARFAGTSSDFCFFISNIMLLVLNAVNVLMRNSTNTRTGHYFV